MAEIDFFASIRIADSAAEPTDFAIADDENQSLFPAVPTPWEREKPQKSAMFPLFPEFPLTSLIVELIRHPNPWKADPVKAAERFGLKVEVTEYYIRQERARRGL